MMPPPMMTTSLAMVLEVALTEFPRSRLYWTWRPLFVLGQCDGQRLDGCLSTQAPSCFDRHGRRMRNDFGSGVPTISALAATHAHTTESLGTIRFACAGMFNHTAQFAGSH